MTDREQLIGQGARTLREAVQTGQISIATHEEVEVLFDAGWRPPPSGDVIEGAARALHEYLRPNQDCCEPGPAGVCLSCELKVGVLADTGFLRTTPPSGDVIEHAYQRVMADPEFTAMAYRGAGAVPVLWRALTVLAAAGLLATPVESMSIPVPPPGDAIEQAEVALAEAFTSPLEPNPDFDRRGPLDDTNPEYVDKSMKERRGEVLMVVERASDGGNSIRALTIPEVVAALARAGRLAWSVPGELVEGGQEFIANPVPPPDELVERVARGVAPDVYDRPWSDRASWLEAKAEAEELARRALLAPGEGPR